MSSQKANKMLKKISLKGKKQKVSLKDVLIEPSNQVVEKIKPIREGEPHEINSYCSYFVDKVANNNIANSAAIILGCINNIANIWLFVCITIFTESEKMVKLLQGRNEDMVLIHCAQKLFSLICASFFQNIHTYTTLLSEYSWDNYKMIMVTKSWMNTIVFPIIYSKYTFLAADALANIVSFWNPKITSPVAISQVVIHRSTYFNFSLSVLKFYIVNFLCNYSFILISFILYLSL